jgi:Adenylate and Guanylate cyclase catalytic domain
MVPESENNLRLEIGHVLFIDLVGYSKLLIEEQKERLRQLTVVVLGTSQVAKSTDEELVRLPTGDGMALVFHHNAEEPVHCAIEIAQALQSHPSVQVRMGIHSGPVSKVQDVSGRANIAGGGINVARRVIDCGDAGHILLSRHVAEDLEQYGHWKSQLHDLGECEVKHGVRLGVVNLYRDNAGNPTLPKKFQAQKKRTRLRWIAGTMLILLALGVGFFLFERQPTLKAPEKSIAVLPMVNSTGDPANEYFSDGMSEELISSLSRLSDLQIHPKADKA